MLTGFVIIMLPTVTALGFWQLQRADEKKALEDAYLQQLAAPVREAHTPIEPFERIRLLGSWGRHTFLIDNQVYQGKVGYWAVQTFESPDGVTYLVNRGWVQAPPSRDELPSIPVPSGTVSIQVLSWPQLGLTPMWGQDPWPAEETVRVQQRDIIRMAERTGAVPVELRLEPGSPGVLVPPPQEISFGRSVHLGYAVQWFGLGIVLIIGYFIVYRKSRAVAPSRT